MEIRIKLFADGAKKTDMISFYKDPNISGLTTNPSLMRKEGVTDYEKFAKELLEVITEKQISFEVFSDEPNEMKKQALKIASWGKNVYVKIPVINTKNIFSGELIKELTQEGIQLNITAIFTKNQIEQTLEVLHGSKGAYLSVFAGRMADTGFDPIPLMTETVQELKKPQHKNIELLWASTREFFNIIEADRLGCDIITVPSEILKKFSSYKKDLTLCSQETVLGFYKDALESGFKL